MKPTPQQRARLEKLAAWIAVSDSFRMDYVAYGENTNNWGYAISAPDYAGLSCTAATPEHPCGTPACIWGHMIAQMKAARLKGFDYKREADVQDYFGINDYDNWMSVTHPSVLKDGVSMYDTTLSGKRAAKMLKHYAKTGKVKW